MVDSWTDLDVYKNAFALQQDIFTESKSWPRDETYSLIDQIRRSSRSVGANISESWAKRRYPKHFLSKLSDADGELQETRHWLRTACASGYLNVERGKELAEKIETIGRQLGAMMNTHESFCF